MSGSPRIKWTGVRKGKKRKQLNLGCEDWRKLLES
jgi:hypothetical protein